MFLQRLLLIVAALLVAWPAWGQQPAAGGKRLTVHFFDVGQGDAALIISPTGKTVLIDGGPPEADTHLVARLRSLVRGPLDLVVLTHPHLDHLAGLGPAITALGAQRFMDPGFDHPSEAYRDLLELVGREVGQVMVPSPSPSNPEGPLTVNLGEGASLTVVWPRHPREPFLSGTRSDANSNSIVAKLVYGKTAVLFTGDEEKDTEELLLRRPVVLESTVLKVAHHGGRYSSTQAFLQAVRPQAAVISCGKGNEYGHPTEETLGRLRAVGAQVLRTDQHGEVKAVSDGTTLTLEVQRGRKQPLVLAGRVPAGPVVTGPLRPEPGQAGSSTAGSPPANTRYVSLKGSKVFHREDCGTLKRAKTQERSVYTSRAEALRERRPAEDCDP